MQLLRSVPSAPKTPRLRYRCPDCRDIHDGLPDLCFALPDAIFDLTAEERETRALVDQSSQRLEGARRNATVQITQARRSVDVAEDSRRVAEQSRDLAKETERLARVAFQAGTGTSLDLIESGRRLREAESQLALREFGLVQARISALLALSRCHW